MQEKLDEIIEDIIRIYAPHTEILLTDLDRTKSQILKLFDEEYKKLGDIEEGV